MVLGEITSPWRGAGPPNSGMDKQGARKARHGNGNLGIIKDA